MGTLNSPTAPGQPKKDSASAAQESAECSRGGACNHVGEAGGNNGEYCKPDPCIPDGYGNGQQEQRICQVAEVEAHQEKRPPERHGDRKYCKTISKHGRAGDLQFEVQSSHGSPHIDAW